MIRPMLDKYGDLFWEYLNDTPITVQCIVGAVALYALYRLVIKKKYNFPPGPRGLPLLGNLLELRNAEVLTKINEWQKKYGDVITTRFGPFKSVVISDADVLLDAFVSKSTQFSDRPFFYSLHIFSEGSKSILASPHGDTLKYMRKVASQSLRQYLTGSQFEERCHEVVTHIAKLIESEKGRPISFKDFNSLGTFNTMHGLCFGSVKDLDDPVFQELYNFFDDFNKEAGNGFLEDMFPPLRYWPTEKFRRLSGQFMGFLDYLQERIEERRAEMIKDSPICLADIILLVQQELRESDSASLMYMTDVHTRQIIADVFGGGVDTSRVTLDWLLLVLVAHPDIQARIHKEIDEVVGETVPNKEHRSKLVYTQAVILEVLRLYEVAPMGVPHLTKCDASVGGYDIPAKTVVMVNQHLIMRHPKYWDDPLTFKPQRFMNEDQSKIVARNRAFIPFSVGPRSCPGESLAKLNIFYLAVGLLQKYSFSLPPGVQADFTADANFFGYRPKEYKVIATPR